MFAIMGAVFTIVVNVTESRTGGGGNFNPLREIGRFFTRTLNSADRLAPNLSTFRAAISRLPAPRRVFSPASP
jgi:hypothetical protein